MQMASKCERNPTTGMNLMKLASFILFVGVVTAAHAAPGDLDTTFSGDGKIVETALASSFANAVAIQADGRSSWPAVWAATSSWRDTTRTALSTPP
jgi:hypothetical protein